MLAAFLATTSVTSTSTAHTRAWTSTHPTTTPTWSLRSTARCGEHDSSAVSSTSTDERPNAISKAPGHLPHNENWHGTGLVSSSERFAKRRRASLAQPAGLTGVPLETRSLVGPSGPSSEECSIPVDRWEGAYLPDDRLV